MFILCCLTDAEIGVENTAISQPDGAQHGRESFVWVRDWDRSALGFPFGSELLSSALSAWRLHIHHQQGSAVLLTRCLPGCPRIIFT